MFRPDIVEPDRIADSQPLLGDSLCLDSMDVLELGLCIEEEFGVAVPSGEGSHSAFTSIATLADFIRASAQTSFGACPEFMNASPVAAVTATEPPFQSPSR
jgi:acyl carrier protein